MNKNMRTKFRLNQSKESGTAAYTVEVQHLEAEARGLPQVWGQPTLQSKTLSQKENKANKQKKIA